MTDPDYDSRCFDLAEIFLSGEPRLMTPGHIESLAREIQNTIEGYIEYELDCLEHGRPVPPHGSGP